MPSLFLLMITYLGFISLGLPDSLLGVVWPSVYPSFGLTASYMGVVLSATVIGYLASSLQTGPLVQRWGVGGLLAVSCGSVTLSLAGFALAPSWPLFVASAVFAGLGAGAIDSGLNAYAARNFSARHMSWLHACWGVGATLGATAATTILARDLPWQWTYGAIAGVMLGMTVLFARTRNAWNAPPAEAPAGAIPSPTMEPVTMREALRHPLVWAQVLVFFVYTGTEMTAANWSYTLLTQHRLLPEDIAGPAMTAFWLSLTLGRFGLGAIADRVGVRRLLGLSVTGALLGGLGFALAPWPMASIIGLALLGASLAPIYPGLMTLTPRHLGRLTEHAVGFQVGAATLGQVALPSLGGLVLVAYGPAALSSLMGLFVVLLWGSILALLWLARHAEHGSQP
jgi:fucose permease